MYLNFIIISALWIRKLRHEKLNELSKMIQLLSGWESHPSSMA